MADVRWRNCAGSTASAQPAFYNWKNKYGGKRLKEPEEENLKLKRMYADVSMQRDALKDLIEKKFLRTCRETQRWNSCCTAWSYGVHHLQARFSNEIKFNPFRQRNCVHCICRW